MTFVRFTPDGAPPRRADVPGPGFLLDRDGCLTVEAGHLGDADDLVPIPGSQDAVARLVAAGVRLAVVTNQSAIARGVVDEAGMQLLHGRLVDLFPGIEAVYHCPHRREDRCACRKPSAVMPAAACHDLGLDPATTWFVGDHMTDAKAALAAGLGTRLLLTGHGHDHAHEAHGDDVVSVPDLAAAVDEYLSVRSAADSSLLDTSETTVTDSPLTAMYDGHVSDLHEALTGLATLTSEMEAAATLLANSLRAGGSVLVAGNGGSAAEAQHLSAEFVGRLRPDRNRAALSSVALHADTSSLTAVGNDYGYDEVFARQVQAIGRPGDALVVLSTSGRSANCVRAVEEARARDIATIGLLGGTPGALHDLVDVAIAVPSVSVPAIQECHLVLVHVLVERTEDLLGITFTD